MKCANEDDVKLLGITIDLFKDQNRLYTHDFKKKIESRTLSWIF